MNRIRLSALLLALVLLTALAPLSAHAEEEYGAGLVRLRFAAGNADASLLTLVDADGRPVLPLNDEGGDYLLAPGVYTYFMIDPVSGELLVPVTPLALDGSSVQVEVALFEDAQTLTPDEPAQIRPLPETENGAQGEDQPSMPVIFRSERGIDFTGLTITSADGRVMQPYMDPISGMPQFENYLLPPGQYGYWYRDSAGRIPDQQGSFSVAASGMQTVTLDFEGGPVEACFSATAVNPYYAGLIREEFIPTPSVSPEESLVQLIREVDILSGDPRYSMNMVYYAGDEEEAADQRGGNPVVYDTPEGAGAALKRALIQRQEEVTIRVKTHIKPTKDIWWDMCWMIYNEAIRHTGAATEGDYLRYEYGGVTCNGSATGSDETSTYYYKFIYSPLYFTSLAQETELTGRVSAILNGLGLSGKSDEQKIRAVYNYLCENVAYQQAEDTLGFTAYSALVNGHAACQGFSVAFYRLCLELGVDARVVTSQDMGHAWNIARADGRNYYALDSTWDAGKAPEERKFYLRGRSSWTEEHSLGDEFIDGRFASYSFPNEDYGVESDAVIRSVSLLFDGLLRIKYYFVLPEDLIAEQGSCLSFSRGGEVFQTVPLSEGRREGEYICFYCSVDVANIDTLVQARIRRGDGSYVTISTQSGTLYANGFFFSPMEYARQMKTGASSANMRALAQALEDYGIAAANYFNGGSETLRDEVLAVRPADLERWSIRAEGQKPAGFRGASVSVMFEADNSLRLYLQFNAGAEPGRYSYTVDGRSAAVQRKNDGTVFLSVENIAADALDTAHSFTISDGTDSYTVSVSVLGYAKTAIERGGEAMANLGRALYLYNRAAENYFGA